MPRTRNLLCVVALVLAVPALAGNVYKWTDANGVVHYSDRPQPQADASSVNPMAIKPEPGDVNRAATRPDKPAETGGDKAGAAEVPDQVARVRHQRCQKAKKRLVKLQKKARKMTRHEGARGSQGTSNGLSLADAREIVKKYCQ